MAGDWIKVYRKLLKSEIFENADLLQAAVWCLLKATHKPRAVVASTGRGAVTVQIEPGQMVFGRKSAGRQLGCSEASAKRRILRLASLGFLTCHPSTHFSIVTICNWSSYQKTKRRSDCPISTPSDRANDKATVQATIHKQEVSKNAQEDKELSSRPKSVPVCDPADRELAEYIWNRVKALQPSRRAPDLDKWSNDIRMMRERDRRPLEAIKGLFDLAHRDSFWQTNILSPGKLREKFDDLELRLTRTSRGAVTNRSKGVLTGDESF